MNQDMWDAYLKWFISKDFPFTLSDPKAEILFTGFQGAWEWRSKPSEPTEGALTLSAEFFTKEK